MVNVDKFLSIANDYRKDNLGDNLIALLPMIIKDNNKLSVIVPFVLDSDRVWDRNESVVPQYFIEIDPKHYEVSKFSLDSISKNSSDGSLN